MNDLRFFGITIMLSTLLISGSICFTSLANRYEATPINPAEGHQRAYVVIDKLTGKSKLITYYDQKTDNYEFEFSAK